MPARTTLAATAPVALALLLSLAGCSKADTASGPTVAVSANDTACAVASTTLKAGTNRFAVTNAGSKVTEVYVYAGEGGTYTKVVSEVENLGPGTSRTMKAKLSAGTYEVACKPGQSGDGIRTRITVTG